MSRVHRYPTIEDDWQRLYAEFPEVYDRFTRTGRTPGIEDVVNRWFPLHGTTILDIGCGTGKSTLGLARHARFVLGLDCQEPMIRVAVRHAGTSGMANVAFVRSMAESIPLAANSVDIAAAITAPNLYDPAYPEMERLITEFVLEVSRVVRPGGYIIKVDIAPRWLGGDLAPVLFGKSRCAGEHEDWLTRILVGSLGFSYRDFFQKQQFASVEDAIEVIGFIYGQKVIAHLLKESRSAVKWKLRVHYKQVGEKIAPPHDDRWGFEEWAPTYDEDVARAARTDDWMFEDYDRVLDTVVEWCELSDNAYSTVLEIGAGTGNLTSRLAGKGLRIIATDPSAAMRRACRQKGIQAEVQDGGFLRIPASDESVDAIVSSYAFHHLAPDEKGATIEVMKRALRPGGRIVIADLMFRDAPEKERITRALRDSGRGDTADEIDDEYPALADDLERQFRGAGFSFRGRQLTPSVWVCSALLKAPQEA